MLQKSGFTLIEFLVTITILVLATGLVLPSFNFFRKQSSLDGAAQEITSALRLAQNQTTASENSSSFGIYFETNKFTVFKGGTFSPSSPDNKVHLLSPSLTISEIDLGGTNFVVFDRLTGDTANYGSVKIEQVNDNTKNKTVFIDASGIVSLSYSPPDGSERNQDSRHVELLYNQNTQNASILKLSFTAAGVTQDIDYQFNLNDDKTQFFWEGTVDVSGSEQKIKIHTHELTLSSAIFCIHRDRRYNSQDLSIYLDGQNLINYSSTGTTTPGTSIWAEEPQNQ